ncbi:UNVERIFIED_CONTAM: PAS domain S-box protein, partial [Pseudomonas aeruginosa]
YSKLSRDLSERRAMEQQLAQANRLQQAILDFAPFAIVSTTAEGLIRSVNPAAERMLGQSSDDLLGKTRFSSLFEPADVAARAAEL